MKSKLFVRKLPGMTRSWDKIKHFLKYLKGANNATSYNVIKLKATSCFLSALWISVFFLNKHEKVQLFSDFEFDIFMKASYTTWKYALWINWST